MLGYISVLLLGLAAIITDVVAIPTISALGAKFFTSDGNQFYIKGVAYQLTRDDPLVDTTQCQLDAALMKTLGANSIRVYHVDGTANHEGCMNAFAAAGIYLWVDLDSFDTYLDLNGEPSWNQNQSASFKMVMDNFAQYDNTAGFFVGNEVLNTLTDSVFAPYLLAAAADLKTYRAAKGYRPIPIGYSATDSDALRPMLSNYLVCRPNATEHIDFYSLNAYEWCGTSSSYTISGYNQLEQLFSNYPVPVFFSEDGCNTAPPRTFADQSAIFGSEMSGTFSGAIIYEWIEEVNNYGLVEYGPNAGATVNVGSSIINGWSRQGTPTPVAPDFTNLQAQWATLTPTGIPSSAYAASVSNLSPPPCPSSTAGTSAWTINPSLPLPTIGEAAVTASQASATSNSITSSASSSSSSSTSTKTSATAATTKGAAGKTNVNPLSTGEMGFMGMFIALMTLGAAVVVWL